jgi:Na+-translocating ferredoxin:NAD+ oxidoreductase subunit B
VSPEERADEIDALLPQTQCGRCGYSGCRPYAQAIAANAAPINRCPPGGRATIEALARRLGVPVLPLDPASGVEAPALLAVIDEERCIGCAKCLPPCPVDAIVGARHQLHTVIMALCTGCELCVAPCPVDCIRMAERPSPAAGKPAAPSPALNRARFQAHTARIARRADAHAQLLAARKRAAHRPDPP